MESAIRSITRPEFDAPHGESAPRVYPIHLIHPDAALRYARTKHAVLGSIAALGIERRAVGRFRVPFVVRRASLPGPPIAHRTQHFRDFRIGILSGASQILCSTGDRYKYRMRCRCTRRDRLLLSIINIADLPRRIRDDEIVFDTKRERSTRISLTQRG